MATIDNNVKDSWLKEIMGMSGKFESWEKVSEKCLKREIVTQKIVYVSYLRQFMPYIDLICVRVG